MAQSACKTCEICVQAPGSQYCTDCEQYFCENCKTLHLRTRNSKGHRFQGSDKINPEETSLCTEHNDEFIFLCTKCEIPVCKECMAGNHNGHKISNLKNFVSKLEESLENDLQRKLDVIAKNLETVESESVSYNLDIQVAAKMAEEDGERIKALIDKHISDLCVSMKDKDHQERKKYSDLISELKTAKTEGDTIKQKYNELKKQKSNAGTITKLKTLSDEIEQLSVHPLPARFPSIKYEGKEVTEETVKEIIGKFNFRELRHKKTDSDNSTKDTEKKKTTFVTKLFKCSTCGYENHITFPPSYQIICHQCKAAGRGLGYMEFVKDV